MLDQPVYRKTERTFVENLVARHPWATMVTAMGEGEVIVSHLPVLVQPDSEQLTVLGHLAAEDGLAHDLGNHATTLVVQGPNGYVSPSFYRAGPYVPTWNFFVAHLSGRPRVLRDDAAFEVLERTVDYFESQRPEPWQLDSVSAYAHQIAGGTAVFSLTPEVVVAKAKGSQDKPAEVIDNVLWALEDTGDPHANPLLAAAMREVGGNAR